MPPFHRQADCIPSAAIRWPDFGDRPSLGRPSVQIFRHSDTPLLSFSPRRRCQRPTPERVLAADHRSGAGFPEADFPTRQPRPIESNVLSVPEHFGADLDELLPQHRQRPLLHGIGQSERPHEVAETALSRKLVQTTFVAGILTSSATGIQRAPITAGSGRANAITSLSRWYNKSARP